MFSHDSQPGPSPLAGRSLRRGGPFLFRTIWPEVRAALAEASGLEVAGARAERPEATGPRPPYSRAA